MFETIFISQHRDIIVSGLVSLQILNNNIIGFRTNGQSYMLGYYETFDMASRTLKWVHEAILNGRGITLPTMEEFIDYVRENS